jgi:2-dehydropantoate 2-reductase
VARTIDEVLDTKFDFVFISTKLVPEIITTDRVLGPLITSAYKHPQPIYVLLQNGLGIERDLYRALKENHSQPPVIISTALYIVCNVVAVNVTHGPFVSETSIQSWRTPSDILVG